MSAHQKSKVCTLEQEKFSENRVEANTNPNMAEVPVHYMIQC